MKQLAHDFTKFGKRPVKKQNIYPPKCDEHQVFLCLPTFGTSHLLANVAL